MSVGHHWPERERETIFRVGGGDGTGKIFFSWTLNCKMEDPVQTMAVIKPLWREVSRKSPMAGRTHWRTEMPCALLLVWGKRGEKGRKGEIHQGQEKEAEEKRHRNGKRGRRNGATETEATEQNLQSLFGSSQTWDNLERAMKRQRANKQKLNKVTLSHQCSTNNTCL